MPSKATRRRISDHCNRSRSCDGSSQHCRGLSWRTLLRRVRSRVMSSKQFVTANQPAYTITSTCKARGCDATEVKLLSGDEPNKAKARRMVWSLCSPSWSGEQIHDSRGVDK